MVTIGATSRAREEFAPELLAVALYKGESPRDLGEDAERVVSGGDFGGKTGETALLYGQDGPAPRLLLVGLGERDLFTPEKPRRAAATAARTRQALKLQSAAFLPALPDSTIKEIARTVAEGARLGLYRFDRHKSAAEDHDLERSGSSPTKGSWTRPQRVPNCSRVAEGAVLARDLANEPSNVATPEYLAQMARAIAEKYGMELEVLDRAGIEEEGLTGLSTVGRSASNEPYFIALEHRGEATPRPSCS